MSDEYSSGEMSLTPQRLMPRSPSIPEHHRILNLNAIHTGNQTSTIKAHKVRMDGIDGRVNDLEEAIDELKDDLSEVSDLKTELAKTNHAVGQLQLSLSSHGVIIGDVAERLKDREGKLDVRKTIISGVFGLLIAIVAALGGYWAHPSGGPSYVAPTHQQAMEIDQKLKDMDPDGKHGFAPH